MEIAILIPCYNEELTVGKVIQDFQRELPNAKVYVYDNNSKDKTSEVALKHGAIVRKELRQGKGNAVRSMFMEIDADYYIMVDGDDTYPAEFVHELLKPLMDNEADMVIGDRLSNGTYKDENERAFHNLGNNLVKGLINKLYKTNIQDIMTGYRGFNKFFVKSFPVMSPGFEIETELSIHTLDKRFKIKEVAIDYRDRPEGSESKLNTFTDGIKVLKTIFTLFKDYKPFAFFSIWSALFLLLGLLVGIPVIVEFFGTQFVTKVPSAILAVGFVMLAVTSFTCGLILDTVASNNRKQYEMELHRVYKETRGKVSKKYINGRSLFISVILGFFLGIGFMFFFVPIRNVSLPILLIVPLLMAVILLLGAKRGCYSFYRQPPSLKRGACLVFMLLFSLFLLASLKGEQLYLQDNHFLIVLYVYVSTYLTLLLMVMTIVHFILTLNVQKEVKDVPKYRILLYALPSIVIFSFYLIGFFPGLMTVDSTIQWQQIHTNQYNDWHPVVHTWFLKLITQIWDYPAAIAIAQILIMSLTFGYGMYAFEKFGVKRWLLFIVIAAFALMPLNGIYSVTLWKDVLYSTATMFLTIILFQIVMTKGKWLDKPSHLFLFFLAGAEFVFFRHNGFPAFVVTMIIFLILYRLRLKKMYIVGLAVIALHFIVTGPIFKYFDVVPSDPNEAYSVPIQQIGRIIAYDGNITKEQLDFYDRVLPIEEWETKYNPFLADPLKGHPDYNREFLYENKSDYFKYWLELCLQNPKMAIDAYTDLSAIVWSINKPSNSYQYLYAGETPTPEILKENNIEPIYGNLNVKSFLSRVLEVTSGGSLLAIYRPAIYLFSIVLLLFIATLQGRFKLSLIALPVLLNAASVAVALPAQDVRYLYANFLVLPIIFLATITRKQHKEE